MRPSWLIPVVIFVICLAVRLGLIFDGPFHVDTLNQVVLAENMLADGRLRYYLGSGYPLTLILAAMFIKLFGPFVADPVTAYHGLSVLAGALSVALLYVFLVRMFSRTAAVLASVLFSFHPLFLSASLYGNTHLPALAFGLAGWMALGPPGEPRRGTAGAVFFGLMAAARLQDFVFLVPALVFFLRRIQGRSWPHAMGIIAGAAAAGAVFYLPYFLPGVREDYLRQWSVYGGLSLSPRLWLSILGYNGQFFLRDAAGPAAALAALGGVLLGRNSPPRLVFTLLWLGVPLVVFNALITLAPRFYLVMLPALAILNAAAFDKLRTRGERIWRITQFIFLLVLAVSLGTALAPLWQRHRRSDIREYIRWVDRTVPADAVIFLADDLPFFERYGHVEVRFRPTAYHDYDPRVLEDFRREIDGLLAAGRPVYLPGHSLAAYDPADAFSGFLRRTYRLNCVGLMVYDPWHRGDYRSQRCISPLWAVRPADDPAPAVREACPVPEEWSGLPACGPLR